MQQEHALSPVEFHMFDSIVSPVPVRVRCSLACAALIAAGAFGCSGAARAANANFSVAVAPIPIQVSVGRPGLATYAAYTVSITNTAGNTNNNIRFSGSTSVTGDLAGAAAPYVETIPAAACTSSGATVQCNFAQMKAGANNSFVVIFSTPTLAKPTQNEINAAISFSWSFDYASGNSSGTPSSIICNGKQIPNPPCTGSNSTTLITTQSDPILSSFQTYIPSAGGTFFTGNGTSALPATVTASGTDLLPTAQTTLKIPKGQNLTTAQATVTVAAGGLTGDTTTTNTVIYTVPSTGATFPSFATIELRRDASTIASGAKISRAAVMYSHDDVGTGTALPPCPANGDPRSLAPPVCLFSKTEFTKKTAPTPDDVGDWLFVIHADENGKFDY
jgi:hypothetical protein